MIQLKLFFGIILKIIIILAILIGCATTQQIEESDPVALFNQGLALLEDGQYDQAIVYFNKAIEINPRYAEAYNSRGYVFRKRGQYEKAISDCNKAIEINPRYAEAYNNRGLAYYYIRAYDKAWDDVHEAQNLGYDVHPGFLEALRQSSGRKK